MKAEEFKQSKIVNCKNNISIYGTKNYLTVENAERYAKQKVIEELENMNNIINDLDNANMVLQLRIKELKQEI